MNLVGESDFGLPSTPVRAQIVSFYCSSGGPILSKQQCSPHHVEIGQRTGDEQSVNVLGQTAVAHLSKAEDALDDQNRMLALGAHLRFVSILQALGRRQWGVAARLRLGEVTDLWRYAANNLSLFDMGAVATHARLAPVQQLLQGLAIVNVGRGCHDRVNQLGLAVHSHMRLHAEVPLISLLDLVHLWVALTRFVLGRRRGVDNRCVHDRSHGNRHALGAQVAPDLFKQPPAQTMLLQQMPELAHRGLIGHGLSPQINAHEGAHRHRLVQRFLHRRIREIERVRKKINLQLSAPAPPAGGHCPASDIPARSTRKAHPREPRAPFRPEMPRGASSCHSVRILRLRASSVSSVHPIVSLINRLTLPRSLRWT